MEQNTCNKCGRPMQYNTEHKCNYNDCCMNEYCGCKLGRIKEMEPACDSTAVIPSITVESVEGITNLANCLVHVEDINTTFYVDDKHRVMITWAGPVDIPGYDMENNPNGYRDQILTDIERGLAVIYDKHGKGYTFGIYDSLDANGAVTQAINDRLDEMAEDGTLADIIATYMDDVAHVFDTVADMKASTELANGSYARTLGFYTINDGGGATYKITNSGTANEMDIIAVGSLYANLVYGDEMFAEQFGAKPVLNFNNKTIIEYAIAHTNKLSFGDGDFYTTTAIALASNTQIEGAKTRIYSDSPYVFSGNNLSDIYISHLELESTVDTSDTVNMNEVTPDSRGYTTLSSIMDIGNSTNITVENCVCHGGFTGLYIHDSDNVTIKNNECYESSSKIVCLSKSKFKLLNNYIHDVKINETDYYSCYLFQATADSSFTAQESSVIDGNRFENNENWDAIMAHRYNKMVITNNSIKNVRTGIDLSVVTNDTDNGNLIISDNYIEGTSTNRWGEDAINQGILVIGDSKTNKLIISNNIIKNFGLFSSPSGGDIIHIQNIKEVVVNGNIIDFTTTVNTVNGAIICRGDSDKIIITGNAIQSKTLKCIYLYRLTCNLLTIKNNTLETTYSSAIEEDANSTITNAIIENACSSTNQLLVRNGAKFNGKTYSTDDTRAIFSRTDRYLANISTFDVSANSSVQKFINKTDIGYDGSFGLYSLFSVTPATATFPAGCIIRAKYSDGSNIQLRFYNLTGSNITIPDANYVVKIDS